MRSVIPSRSRMFLMVIATIFGIFAPLAAQAAVPTVTSFTPTGGPVGSQVYIFGSNFTGATAVQVS